MPRLRLDPHNARLHPERNKAIIRQSLEEVGAGRSILVGGEGHIIAGNGVYEQAQALGLKVREVQAQPDELIAVVRQDLVGDAAVRAALLDNAAGETSTWDMEALRQLDADMPNILAGLDEVQAELAAALDVLPEPGAGGDDYDATPEDGPTRAQPGDLWIIGGVHRLLVGDCTDPANVARLMQGERADAVVTDPPYSSGGFTRGDRTLGTAKKYVQSGTAIERPDFAGDNRDQRAWIGWMERWLALYLQHVKAGAIIASWTDWRQLPATTDAIQGGGWVWRGIAVWDKTEGARPIYGRFRPQAEYLVWGSAGNLAINDGHPCYPGVITKSVDSGKEHITQKPIEVGVWSLSMVPENGLNLDPFLGSGTTLIAAHRTGRRCYGMEIEPRYADVILRRAEAEGLTVERAP